MALADYKIAGCPARALYGSTVPSLQTSSKPYQPLVALWILNSIEEHGIYTCNTQTITDASVDQVIHILPLPELGKVYYFVLSVIATPHPRPAESCK